MCSIVEFCARILNSQSVLGEYHLNMSDAVDYVCGLDKNTLAKARKELNEDPKERLGAVQTLREWILQQKHMTCNTGEIIYRPVPCT